MTFTVEDKGDINVSFSSGTGSPTVVVARRIRINWDGDDQHGQLANPTYPSVPTSKGVVIDTGGAGGTGGEVYFTSYQARCFTAGTLSRYSANAWVANTHTENGTDIFACVLRTVPPVPSPLIFQGSKGLITTPIVN